MRLIGLLLSLLLAAGHTPASAQAATPPASLLLFGAFTYGGVWSGDEAIVELEQIIGRELDIIHWYMSWHNDWDADLVASVAAERRLPLITWESTHVAPARIAAGEQDRYIRSFARGVREFGRVVYLRPFPEMNGDWTPWNGDPPALKSAWRRIADIFRQEGADNVRWVWSPNVTDEPPTQANRMENYFPGEEYVDILALDGFNWGDVKPHIGWQSAEEIFADGYRRVTALARKPVWFAEIGSTDEGGDKAAWVHDLLRNSWRWFPRLTAIIWFDQNKEADWRVSSSARTADAFRLLP